MSFFQFDGMHFFLFDAERVIRWYGIILMLGAVAGSWLATKSAKQRGYDPVIVWDLLTYLLIGGVIGARLWHIFTPMQSQLVLDQATGELVNPYFAGGTVHLLDILSVWKGGLGIPGAVIGGAVVLYFYSRKRGLSFAEWADIAAPSLPLGQAIGRWGNFFNQELYGAPTNLPWAIRIEPAHRVPGFEQVEYYHPLFLYESLLNLANMFFLLWLSRRYADRLKSGDIFLAYLVTYPVIRFSLEFLRLNASLVAGININQTFMAVIAVCAGAALYLRHRNDAVGK
ncbi:MAG: prolipoprotein diacylglyceryl transferase [Anaerolineae bacterium]|nr:MAG: prolipoprotein diacylglyceryl transferase [Anaerolineae bacterium]